MWQWQWNYLKMIPSQSFHLVYLVCKHSNYGWAQQTFKSKLWKWLLLLLFAALETVIAVFSTSWFYLVKQLWTQIDVKKEVTVVATSPEAAQGHGIQTGSTSPLLLGTQLAQLPYSCMSQQIAHEPSWSNLLSVLFCWFFHVDLVFYCSEEL